MPKNNSANFSTDQQVLAFDLEKTPGHLLRRAHQQSRDVFRFHMEEFSVSREVFSVLVTIYQNPHATYTTLSEISGFDRNTLAEMVDRLVKNKWAIRKKSKQDGRAYSICLTDPGKRHVRKMVYKVNDVRQDILAPIPEAMRPSL